MKIIVEQNKEWRIIKFSKLVVNVLNLLLTISPSLLRYHFLPVIPFIVWMFHKALIILKLDLCFIFKVLHVLVVRTLLTIPSLPLLTFSPSDILSYIRSICHDNVKKKKKSYFSGCNLVDIFFRAKLKKIIT